MENSEQPSRRQVLTAAAVATVTLPMLQAALGQSRSASANPTVNPTAGAGGARVNVAAAAPAAGGRPGQAAAEKAGWFATALKPADVKDGEFTPVKGHSIILSRTGKDITAFTSKCTHQGCDLSPVVKPASKTVTCGCHKAQFNLDGTVAAPPAKNPLAHYAIRVAADGGLIEVDPGTNPAKDAKEFSIAVA